MNEIMNNWRVFAKVDNSHLIAKRLEEALSRRQFLGGAAGAILAAIMASSFFNNLSDDDQDKVIDADPQEWASLDIQDPEYQKAVEEYYSEQGEFLHPKIERPELSGLSPSELKAHMHQAVGELMIAPAELPDGAPYQVAPVYQSDTTGFYAFVSEADLIGLGEQGYGNAIADAERFFEAMPLTALWRYTYGQQAFFSYTSAKDANDGKLFATIETSQTTTNPLTGEIENIKVRKLPIAWTVANKVMLDRITVLHAELEDPEMTKQQMEAIFEKHGVEPSYYRGNKRLPPISVARQMIQDVETSLASMNKANTVLGKHSNKDEFYKIKETLEKRC